MSSVLAKKMPLRSAVRSNKTQPQAACRLMWGWVFLERTRAVRSNKTQPCLKVKMGLGIFRPKADSQWNLVYNAFHRIFVLEKKRFVISTVNVILTWQTCGQLSSMAAFPLLLYFEA